MTKLNLPIVNAPTLICDLPLSKKKIKYRPFVVREQKVLLLAQESGEDEVIYATIRDVIKACTNGEVDLETLPITDLSWLFLQMKISSSGPEQKFNQDCTE